MSVDMNYGRRTGVTNFKEGVKELCETVHKFEPHIRTWVASSGSGLTSSQQALVNSLLDAIDAACASVQSMNDD